VKTLLLFPGRIKPQDLQAAQTEYLRRLERFRIEAVPYPAARVCSPDEARREEADELFKRIRPDDYLVACDERGTPLTTPALRTLLEQSHQGNGPCAGRARLIFLVGGANGLDASIRDRADRLVSLSGLVLAGGIARLVLLEALYRALTLIEGHPYHNT